jgi:hypothetical protein
MLCRHMCMTMRGVQKPGATTVTTFYTGAYESDAALRAEFIGLLAASGSGVSSGAGSSSSCDAGAGEGTGEGGGGGAGHGAYGLGSPRFAPGGPFLAAGHLPVAALAQQSGAAER